MKKLVLMVVVAAAAAAVMMLRKQSSSAGPTMWQKMQEHMEAMPEDFPPRVMFDNVAAVKENTEQILELLRKRDAAEKPESAKV